MCHYSIACLTEQSHKVIRMTTISAKLASDIEKNYVLSDFVESGNEGQVFKAIRKTDSTTVALKLVTDAKHMTEIQNNIVLGETGVRNVNRMVDYIIDHEAEHFALVLEYVPTDLWEYVTNYEPTEDKCKIIMRQIISAVIEMSTLAGLVHLDLKEENILIDPETLNIQISDFSSCMYAKDSVVTLSGRKKSDYFLAPESVKQDKFFASKSIVWVIGLICFNVLNASPDLWDVYNDEIISECFNFKDGISKEAKEFVLKCCEVDVKKRPSVKNLLNLPWLKK